jgi:hypothetical protein
MSKAFISIISGSFIALFTSFTLLCPAYVHSSQHPNLHIRSAFKDSTGRLVVRFEDHGFSKQSALFFQNGNTLLQIEANWDPIETDSNSESTMLSQGWITFNKNKATLQCPDKENDIEFKALDADEVKSILTIIRAEKLKLHPLPQAQEPVYLLQVKGRNEYVYVTAPRYGFDGNYSVYLIQNSKWKKLETLSSSLQELSLHPDLIRLANGGGIYIPAAIDLFLKPAQHRGSPTLMRSAEGKIEELVRPKMNKQLMKRLKISVPSPKPKEYSPCTI